MQDKVNELNNLYIPILKEIENIRQFLGSKCIDHALGFYNRNSIKINDKIASEIYPIPVIFCKLNNINIALDLVSNEKYIGFIRFTFSKEDLLCFNFNLLSDFYFELYSYSYINTNFDFENIEQELIKIQESKERQFKIKISISNTNQIKDIINRLFNNRPKSFSMTSFTCDCKNNISIESYDGCCPICRKESPGKRKFPKTCSVCNESFLVDQFGQGECPNCNWYTDTLSEKNKNEVTYPNLISLNKAKQLYKEGKPFKPDLNDFLAGFKFYGEMKFFYKNFDCCLFRGNNEGTIEFDYNNYVGISDSVNFMNKEDFIENAKIGNEYVRDIWDLVEDPSYM